MSLKLIAAVSLDGAIGNDRELLWKIPEDLQRYKEKTIGNICIVGLKTYENLPTEALLNRSHIVIKYDDGKYIDAPPNTDVYTTHSIKESIKKAKKLKGKSNKEIYVIGGAEIYNQFIDLCDEAEITWINKSFPKANKRFPLDKLFDNFKITGDQNWTISIRDLMYKFTNYEKLKK